MNSKKVGKSRILLVIIFLIAVFLRSIFLLKGGLTFNYDQGRDAFVVQQILKGDLKIQGPPSSTPGLYHGVLYYYFLAPAYFIGAGNPLIVAFWLALLNSLTVFVLYYFAKEITESRKAGLLVAILFAFSFESTQYANWLSNPAMTVFTVPLIYLGLWLWLVRRQTKGAIISAIALGISIQLEIFLAYHLFIVLFWLFVARKIISKRETGKFFGFLILTTATMFIAEIKFGFRGWEGLKKLFLQEDRIAASKILVDKFIIYIRQVDKVVANNLLPIKGFGLILLGLMTAWLLYDWRIKRKKLLSWNMILLSGIFSHISASLFGGSLTPFIAVGIGSLIILVFGLMTFWLYERKRLIAICIIFITITANLFFIVRKNSYGQTLFAIQKDLFLKRELAIIDYMYQTSDGGFCINTITNPFWINTTWSYLFNWYGVKKYGFLPYWCGRDQVDLLGNNLLKLPESEDEYYLLVEPLYWMSKGLVQNEISSGLSKGKIIEKKSFGKIVVYKLLINNKTK